MTKTPPVEFESDKVWAEINPQIYNSDDRVVAIVTTSILEELLRREIEWCFPVKGKVLDKLMDGTLRNFSTRINIARVLGILGENAHKDFERFNNIRNEFAHNALVPEGADWKAPTFSSKRIADFIRAFKCTRLFSVPLMTHGQSASVKGPRRQFMLAYFNLRLALVTRTCLNEGATNFSFPDLQY